MTEFINYWTLSNDDLVAALHERKIDIDIDNTSRKAKIEALKEWDEKNPDEVEKMQPVLTVHEVDDVNPAAPSTLEQVKLAPDGKPLRKFKEPMMLIVFNYREDNEPPTVQLGHNGRCLNIPKDVEVLIPEVFLGVIQDAVEVKVVKRRDPATGEMRDITTRVPRFAYTVLKRGIK